MAPCRPPAWLASGTHMNDRIRRFVTLSDMYRGSLSVLSHSSDFDCEIAARKIVVLIRSAFRSSRSDLSRHALTWKSVVFGSARTTTPRSACGKILNRLARIRGSTRSSRNCPPRSRLISRMARSFCSGRTCSSVDPAVESS